MKFRLFDHNRTHIRSMQDRFILRVLFPPFILLIFIGGLGYWQLNSFLREQAVNELQSAAKTTAIRLEREIAIRETVLKNTGDEISGVKSDYTSSLAVLEKNRTACREYYLDKYTFNGSPDDACVTFSQGSSRASLTLIEDVYIENAKDLQATEIRNINQRLSAYKQFFPETLAILVIGSNDKIVSSAVSGDMGVSLQDLTNLANKAISEPIKGTILKTDVAKLAIFAFPTSGGSVLAAFDVTNENYIRPSWQNTPIDREKALALVTQKNESIVYPGVVDEQGILLRIQQIEDGSSENIMLGGVENIIAAESVANSNWTILVASPQAVVFAPIKDAQFIAILISGVLITGFLWVGTFFIKKTTDNIAQLNTGAMVFGSGRLDYKLNIKDSEKEFKQLADTMNYMAKRIANSEQEIDERNKEFISIATHELRTPMTSIVGYLSMLQEDDKKLSKQNKLLLDNAYDGIIRLRDLVNDMLDAARLEGGREEFRLQDVDISRMVNDIIGTMEVVSKQNNIDLTYNEKLSSKIYADEAKLRIILNNFISNAIKYNHKNGKVTIAHSRSGDDLITLVSNTGPAIPAEQQEHIFQKFFRANSPEHNKISGTGMGMYVTKQYIEAMGGKTWFESKPGEDTVFYFSLPMSSKGAIQNKEKTLTPKHTDSKWIMRWRRRMK